MHGPSRLRGSGTSLREPGDHRVSHRCAADTTRVCLQPQDQRELPLPRARRQALHHLGFSGRPDLQQGNGHDDGLGRLPDDAGLYALANKHASFGKYPAQAALVSPRGPKPTPSAP